jgi:deoxycytidylate deaminase
MGSTLLLTSLYPCSNCAKQIIQAGIRRVYAPKMESHHSPEWFEEKSISELMFRESGIELIEYGEV